MTYSNAALRILWATALVGCVEPGAQIGMNSQDAAPEAGAGFATPHRLQTNRCCQTGP